MKNMGTIIGICIGVAVILLIGVVLMEGYQRTKAASRQASQYQLPVFNATPDAATQTKQTSLGQQVSESQTYMNELNQIQDDGGAADLESISSAASGL